MPGTLAARHELDNRSIAPDQEVGRDFQSRKLPEIRVAVGIQSVGKQLSHGLADKHTRRQAYIMDNQQLNGSAWRAGITVRRGDAAHAA